MYSYNIQGKWLLAGESRTSKLKSPYVMIHQLCSRGPGPKKRSSVRSWEDVNGLYGIRETGRSEITQASLQGFGLCSKCNWKPLEISLTCYLKNEQNMHSDQGRVKQRYNSGDREIIQSRDSGVVQGFISVFLEFF